MLRCASPRLQRSVDGDEQRGLPVARGAVEAHEAAPPLDVGGRHGQRQRGALPEGVAHRRRGDGLIEGRHHVAEHAQQLVVREAPAG
jgi:hypothetical protein